QVKNVSRETEQRLTVFHDLLLQWQARINLIAPSTIQQIWSRHIADSLQVFDSLEGADEIVDIGSGAGLPGMIIAILLAENGSGRVHLVESNGKKCAFLNAAIRQIGLRDLGVDITIVNDRIENALPKIARPKVVTARALASLNDLLRLTEPYLANGTIGVFPKGRDHVAEIADAQRHWDFEYAIVPSRLEDGSVVLKISALRPR
ncbi:MAG: 16S rRNA (guanine(527)-N(7))-methyltransferase RsmG, partial [Hyphomicrobiales bacterium]|nr:16S rRNA (guanine(527)-N(7))-methyltransferase RsmG [Hyphomicrobiales bacterium]